MCGIAGVFNDRFYEPSRLVSEMIGTIRHRGPDDCGVWCDPSVGLGLGHARLSILDLSPAGRQPMISASDRYVIAFNGEIYNHSEIRGQLGGIGWRGHSDTETLLAAVETWGLEKTLHALVGMFAFALWDRVERTLILARDRLGEKPLYYGWCGDVLLFGSELKALEAYPGYRPDIDRNALASFMRYAYVPLPHCIYAGVRKILPGTYVTFSTNDQPRAFPEPHTYWSALDTARHPAEAVSEDEAVDELDRLLRRSIKQQMIADVPLGAFLSGGIDSSTIVALMQAQSVRPVRTFSIGFHEEEYDEAKQARAVAAHLGTEHTELYVTPADALAVIPQLSKIYDEPFGDSSGIPMHLVSQLARRHVTVALSGDGGDELFGGYNRYFLAGFIWRKLEFIPAPLRRVIGASLTCIKPAHWDQVGRLVRPLFGPEAQIHTVGDKLHKLAEILDARDQREVYHRLISQHRERSSLVIGAAESPSWADGQAAQLERQDFTERMMFQDLVGYLPDDILTKVDRAAMAVSLETRVPMLDHRVVEFAWRLPLAMKVRNGQGKWLLRQVLDRYVPRRLVERPKMGFGVPLDTWLRGPLRDWAEDLLEERRLRREGFFVPSAIRRKWDEHLSGRRNWQYWLWNVLMFQAWNHR